MRLRLPVLSISLLLIILISCAGAQPSGIGIEPAELTVQPGEAASFTIRPVFDDDAGSPGKAAIKSFRVSPEVTLDSGFRIMPVKPTVSPEDISAEVVIISSDTLMSGDSARIEVLWGGFSAEAVLKVKKDPLSYIDSEGIITDYKDFDALVNKTRRLPDDYIPPDLVRIEVPTILAFEEVNHLRKPAAEALRAMFEAAESEKGFELHARSGYRSFKTQVSLFESNIRAHGREYAERFSAVPGTSEHQSGLAMDISSPSINYQLEQSFGKTPEGRWAAENAHRFGFIIRYPEGREQITGYAYEPWHLRYTGQNLAEEIYTNNLTLEEYYAD